MPSDVKAPPGRPRSERARLAILEATADLLVEGGLAAATIEGVAARAEVSKVTIYKWWSTRGALAVDAYFHRFRETVAFEDSGDIAHDLMVHIRTLIDIFNSRAGVVMAELIGLAQTDPAMAEPLLSRWIRPRRDAAAAVLQGAIDRGELRNDLDLAAVSDQLYAPLYYRLTMHHEPLEKDLAETLVRTLLNGIRA